MGNAVRFEWCGWYGDGGSDGVGAGVAFDGDGGSPLGGGAEAEDAEGGGGVNEVGGDGDAVRLVFGRVGRLGGEVVKTVVPSVWGDVNAGGAGGDGVGGGE